jgi:hypothetical protein
VTKFTAKQVFVIIAVFLAVFGVLRVSQWVYLRSAVRSPLLRSMQHISGVSSAQVSANGAVTVRITGRANLMTTYQAIESQSQQVVGHDPSSIAVVDHPSAAMTRSVNSLRLIIAQGEATGQYVPMNGSIQKLARQAHMTAVVQLGGHHIFVTLRSPGYWLDEVMPLRLGGGGS